MDFENLYSKFPGFIKYNNKVLNSFLSIAKKLRGLNIIKSEQQLTA